MKFFSTSSTFSTWSTLLTGLTGVCALAALGLALVSACISRTGQIPIRAGQLQGANVLLITIDTLRVDRVGAYGNRNGLTPTLDRLAQDGIRYSHAMSHVPMTLPAHTSILTGLTPRRSGVRNNTTFRLDDRIPTLATYLKRAGYRTGAFVGAFVLDARFGLARDFDLYDDRLPHSDRASFHFAERRAADVVRVAGDWILSQSPIPNPRSPWFAWVHLFDPHAPYDAPPEFRPGRAPYDAEVAYADAMLGTFLERLRSARALDRTLIVVTADHGESLGEHGEATHGLFAYEATIHVPLLLKAAGVRAGVVDAPVGHVDIVPTILELIGAPVPSDLDGRSLVQPLARERPLYFEALDAYLTRGWAPLEGVMQDGWKYIDLPDAELYDLAADPRERDNRITGSDRADVLRRTLAQIESVREGTAPVVALDAEAAGRLRSLGYVGGTTGAPGRSRGRTPTLADDPKRLVALNERFNSGLTAFDDGRPAEALSEFTSVLSARPDFLSARTSAATVLRSLGRSRDAVQLLREAPPDQQESPDLLTQLGSALREAGDLEAAAGVFEHAWNRGDRSVEVEQDLAVVYAGLGRSEAARTLFKEMVTKDPSSATGWYNFGLFELQGGHSQPAADDFRRAVELEPSYGDAWHALGAALVKSDPSGAITAWRQAELLLPHDYDLLFNLGMLTAQSSHPVDAIPYLRRFANEAPRERYARDISLVQQTLARLERAPR